jgi:malate dehydrogenase (quinone)
MGLTLATLVSEIYPNDKISLFERLSACGEESSKGINNAGTGHAGYCELNYTPETSKNSIEINRAIKINSMFECSLEFWSYLDKKYNFFNVKKFLKKTPHISFVWGEKDSLFLKKRYLKLKKQPLFKDMEFTENPRVIKRWAPLLMEGRNSYKKVAATKVNHGTDINFSELIKQLLKVLKKNNNFSLNLASDVTSINFRNDSKIELKINKKKKYVAEKIFLGAGGMTINLLQKLGINEINGYGGFPLSGKWLVSKNKEIISKHSCKVYSQAFPGAPSMSIPHLDQRVIEGDEILMFGPFAGFSTKYLINGSSFDLFKSIRHNNFMTLVKVFFNNLKLTKYLFLQTLMTHKSQMKQLRMFYPNARKEDWKSITAGQRVQIMKQNSKNKGEIRFGTEVIYSKRGSLAALLGASPGASTACYIMIEILTKMYGQECASKKLQQISPSYKININKNSIFLKKIRNRTYKNLGLIK